MFEIKYNDLPKDVRKNYYRSFPPNGVDRVKAREEELAKFNATRDMRDGVLYYIFDSEKDYMFFLLKYG